MALSKWPEATVEQWLQGQRWGGCEEGTADMCAVALKTVHRFQRGAAHRAPTHPQQAVPQVDVTGVQMDEAHAKLRRRHRGAAPAVGLGLPPVIEDASGCGSASPTLCCRTRACAKVAPGVLRRWPFSIIAGVGSACGFLLAYRPRKDQCGGAAASATPAKARAMQAVL
jgi:hypothetical protein